MTAVHDPPGGMDWPDDHDLDRWAPPEDHGSPGEPPDLPEHPPEPPNVTGAKGDGTAGPAQPPPAPSNGHRAVGHIQPAFDLDSLDRINSTDSPTKPPDLPVLPNTFWTTRPYLQMIREIAHSRGASADVAFYTNLARLAAMVPNTARVDTGVGTVVSLNLMVAIVGSSGTGKSKGVGVARRMLAINPLLPHFQDNLPLGSGEGLVEAYMGEEEIDTGETKKNGEPKTTTRRVQNRYNAFFYLDEGAAMFKILERQGATLGETLRTAWTGDTIGSQNATKERNRKVDDYCLGLVVGFQKTTALPLLADHIAGTPQRFLWCGTIDPHIPEDKPEEIHTRLSWDYELVHRAGMLRCHPAIARELWTLSRGKSAGQIEVASHDSHQPSMWVKVAALLAILDGRVEIDLQDWALAKMVWDHSADVRDRLLVFGEQEAAQRRLQRLESRRQDAAADHEGKQEAEQQTTERAARIVARFVQKHPEEGVTRKQLKDAVGKKYRQSLDDALVQAVDEQWVVERDQRWWPGEVTAGDGP